MRKFRPKNNYNDAAMVQPSLWFGFAASGPPKSRPKSNNDNAPSIRPSFWFGSGPKSRPTSNDADTTTVVVHPSLWFGVVTSGLLCLLGGWYYCWWLRKNHRNNKNIGWGEGSPLLGNKGKAKDIIAKYEAVAASRNTTTTKSTETLFEKKKAKPKQQRKHAATTTKQRLFWFWNWTRARKVIPEGKEGEKEEEKEEEAVVKDSLLPRKSKEDASRKKESTVLRCPACRTKISPPTVVYGSHTLHRRCFACCVCKKPLHSSNDENIRRFSANGKIRFQCAKCDSLLDKAHFSSRVAGERVVISSRENGDTKAVLNEIGDDLEQAVYFMTKRCAVCGGDDDDLRVAEKRIVDGRTLYHRVCYETGRPADPYYAPSVTLPPSFCAKYLPQQIILKVTQNTDTTKKMRTMTKKNGATLTTLYFVWKNREEEATKIRKANAAVPAVMFSLDETAPANPNYYSRFGGNTKKKQRVTVATAAAATTGSSTIEGLKLELVPGAEVGPRHPKMTGPASIITANDYNEKNLSLRLAYLKFGLEYTLHLEIPCSSSSDKANSSLLTLEVHLATLKIAIQNRQ